MKREINLPETISFTINGESVNVPTADLPDDALVGLLVYGRRKANDTFNSAKGGENPLSVAEVMEKIKTWDFGSGGPRADAMTKALRDIVKSYLMSAGFKAKDATKEAKDPDKGFELALRHILAAKDGIPAAQVDEAKAKEARAANWPKIEAKAKALVEAQKAATDLDI